MTREEIQNLVEELEKKKENKEELTVVEACIWDMAQEVKKTGQELTERDIEKVKFWMD